MAASLEPDDESASSAWDDFPLLPRACPAAGLQSAAHGMQTTLCALLSPGKGCLWGALTAGDLPAQPGPSKSAVMLESLGTE